MAPVRVVAARVFDPSRAARVIYSAQLYASDFDVDPVWTCEHRHLTLAEAHLCGAQRITDQIVGSRSAELQTTAR